MSLTLSTTHAAKQDSLPHSYLPHIEKSLVKKQGAHSFQELDSFHLPQVHFKEGTLHQALESVHAAYREACAQTKQQPLQINYTGAPTDSRTLDVSLSGTFTDVTKLLAAYYGFELQFTPNSNSIESKPLSYDSAITEADIVLPPDWAELLQLSSKTAKTSHTQTLKKLGTLLDLEKDTKLSHSKKKRSISISGSPLAIAKVQNIAGILRNIKPLQIRVATKYVGFPIKNDVFTSALNGDEMLFLNDGQTQMIMRAISQTKGSQIVTAPSIVLRSQELAKLDVINEFESGIFSKTKQWTGLRMHIYGELNGFDITLNREVFIGQREGLLKKVHYYDFKYLSSTRDGNTTARYSHSHDDINYYVFMTSNTIDATGKSIR